MIKFKHIIFLYFVFIKILFSMDTYNIASDENLTYYQLAVSINQLLKENSNIKLNILTTHGSVDNIKKLRSQKVDFAIVQNDVAFFAENGIGSFKSKYNDLRLVLPFYKEPIFILSRKKNIEEISQIRNKKVSVGLQESGLLSSSKVILKSANLWMNIKKYYYSPQKALEKLKSGQIDILFVNNLNEEMKKLLDDSKIYIVPITEDFVKKLKYTFPYFYNYKYLLNEQDSINTIACYSMLVTRNNVDEKLILKILQVMVNNYNLLEFPDLYHSSKKELFNFQSTIDWHSGVYKFFEVNHIKTSSSFLLDEFFWYIVSVVVFIAFILLFVVSIVLYQMGYLSGLKESSKFLLFLQKVYLYAVKHKYILIILFIFLSYIISILAIKFFEHHWAIEHNVINKFDNTPFIESLFWLFIFNTTGYNGDIFPVSNEGKFIISLIPMLGFGGVITLVGLITSDQIKKYILESKGMNNIKLQDHIIICGWNERASLLIKNLTHKNLESKKQVVILADAMDFNPIEQYHLNKEFVYYVKSAKVDRFSLEKANLAEAEMVIVLANKQHVDPDARTLLSVLTIENYSKELIKNNQRKKPQIYTVAEILDKDNESIAKDVQLNQIITLDDIEAKIFAQAIQTPGILDFIYEVFDYNDYNDIYHIRVDDKCVFLGKTYDEILMLLRKYNILLLSINLGIDKDNDTLDNIKSKYNLVRTVITNPIEIAEQDYKVNIDDRLIVLARYEQDILDARKKLQDYES